MNEMEGMNMDNNPIICQIIQFLTETKFVTKCSLNVSELFIQFIREEEVRSSYPFHPSFNYCGHNINTDRILVPTVIDFCDFVVWEEN